MILVQTFRLYLAGNISSPPNLTNVRKLSLFCAFISCILLLDSCTKDPAANLVPIADAGPTHQVVFPDTVQLKGTGTDKDGVVVGSLWSQLSGPAESALLNPADSTTIVRFTAFGNYSFQLMVIDNDGATGLDTVSVIVSKPPIDSVVFTSSDHGYMDLTFAGNGFENYTDPTTPELALASWTRNGYDDELRAALQFNLSTLPSTTNITSAKLSLFSNPKPINGNQTDANFGSSNAFFIRRITADWDLMSGWFTQPSTTTDGQVYIPHTDSSRLDLAEIDVTAMVKEMLAGTNHGFFLQLESEVQYTSRIFCSSRFENAGKRPVLKIYYKN